MSIVDRWLLPDGVEDVLPPQARQMEQVRRTLLDLFSTWGYDYVIPPMVEFLESLLTGTGRDLDLKTFKVVDLLTGRTMGVRADITPQVARIDAHSLNQEGVARLCYAGTIVHAQPDSMLASRTPLSVGAELFGETSGKGDIEIVSLMVDALQSLGFDAVHVDLGDVEIFRQLVDDLNITADQQDMIFEAVQRKSSAEIRHLGQSFGLEEEKIGLLCDLPGMNGGIEVLEVAKRRFAELPGIVQCIENLEMVATEILSRFDDLDVYFDLSELRGYRYHTGIVFSAFVNGSGEYGGSSPAIAKGGRYDHIGGVFGRTGRGATGFSINVGQLARQLEMTDTAPEKVLAIPANGEHSAAWWQEVRKLRQQGYIVVESGEEHAYDYRLVLTDQGDWMLVPREA